MGAKLTEVALELSQLSAPTLLFATTVTDCGETADTPHNTKGETQPIHTHGFAPEWIVAVFHEKAGFLEIFFFALLRTRRV